MKYFNLVSMILMFALSACATQKTEKSASAPVAVKSAGSSTDTFLPIRSDDPEVRRLFERGVVLTYGFNHQEAHNTYMQAAAQDSDCAMCYWGASLVLGPNINKPMDPKDAPTAHRLAQKALEHSKDESPLHKSLIQALVKRYSPDASEDRSALDQAYADAMRGVAKQFPNSTTAQVLLAEALMDLHPWDFWEKNGQPKSWTLEILETLEAALKLDPDNLNANHLYIHAVEASHHPEKAEPNADRLRALAPDSG